MDLTKQKAQTRKSAFGVRKVAHSKGGDTAACARLLAFLETLPAFGCIAAYMPIRTELSPLPVMQALFESGKNVCVPVISAAGQPLDFSRWTPKGEMKNGPFGAAVPVHDEFLKPDIVITPLLAFDMRGYRLGYGGGFYDRSFEGLRAQKKVTAVGLAYDAQEIPVVPTEPTDQQLEALVTPSRTLTFI